MQTKRIKSRRGMLNHNFLSKENYQVYEMGVKKNMTIFEDKSQDGPKIKKGKPKNEEKEIATLVIQKNRPILKIQEPSHFWRVCSSFGHALMAGDVIKLGKIQFQVLEIKTKNKVAKIEYCNESDEEDKECE